MTERRRPISVEVGVFLPGGRCINGDCTLGLDPIHDPERDSPDQITRHPEHLFQVDPGIYRLSGELGDSQLDGWELPPVAFQAELDEGEEEMLLSVFVRRPGWETFRYGDSWLSFEPRPGFVAIAFEHDAPSGPSASDIAARLVEFGLEPLASSQVEDLPFPGSLANGSILIYLGGGDALDPAAIEAAVAEVQLSDGVPEPEPRVGIPIDLDPLSRSDSGIAVLDRRVFVGFRSSVEQLAEPEAWLADRLGGRPAEVDGLEGVKLVELAGRDPLEDLGRLARLNDDENNFVEYAEPDLITQLVDCQAPQSNQDNLKIQDVPAAWDALYSAGKEPLGSAADVSVTILDRDFPLEHKGGSWRVLHRDAPSHQVADYYDCRKTATGDLPYVMKDQSPHGLNVYGVVGATTANNVDIDGIAPGVKIVLVDRPHLGSSLHYVQVLRWLTGNRKTRPGNSAYGPCPNPSRIVCCAHSPGTVAASTFGKWALSMRKEGVVLVYAAGNEGGTLKAKNGYANNVNTLAVGNCEATQGGFQHYASSNTGKRLDLCAIGERAWALVKGGSVRLPGGGTSLAAATVAGAVALMRTKTPKSSFHEIRDVLRDTARENSDPNGNWSSGRSEIYGSGLLDVGDAVAEI